MRANVSLERTSLLSPRRFSSNWKFLVSNIDAGHERARNKANSECKSSFFSSAFVFCPQPFETVFIAGRAAWAKCSPMLPFWSKFLLFRQFLEHALSRIDKGALINENEANVQQSSGHVTNFSFFPPSLHETSMKHSKNNTRLKQHWRSERISLDNTVISSDEAVHSRFVSSRNVCAIFLVNGNVSLSPFARPCWKIFFSQRCTTFLSSFA